MFTLNLKRKLPAPDNQAKPILFVPFVRLPLPPASDKSNTVFHSIPTKLISPPSNNIRQQIHLITPLLVQSHTYPEAVQKHLNSIKTEKARANRGIGVYKEINWFFKQQIIILWINDRDKKVEIHLQQEVNSVAIGQLKDKCLPSKLKKHYLIAVGIQNMVHFYSLNPYVLQFQLLGGNYKYKINHGLQIQKIKFVGENKMVVATCTGVIELFEFCQNQVTRKIIRFPFYRAFIPVSLSQQKKIVHQILYTPKRIFVLVTQTSPKFWFQRYADYYFFDKPYEQYQKHKYVQVYSVEDKHLVKFKQITQPAVQKKLKSIVPNWSTSTQIASIYLDSSHDKEGQLGIVTRDGCFLVLKNSMPIFLSKEPIFIPSSQELGSCSFLEEKKLDPLKSTTEDLKKKKNYLVNSSLGYQNLTLISDSLFWLGEQRIDGVLSAQLNAEIFDKNELRYVNLVEQNRQWGVFNFETYYTIKQLPMRHFVLLLVYIKGKLNNQYEGYHYKEQKFNQFIEKQMKKLKPERFLRYLIEIIVLQEKSISINQFLEQLIERQMKGENTKDFKDWKHMLSGSVKKKQLMLNSNMQLKIWSLILQLQYKRVLQDDLQDKSYSNTNVYFIAMHNIYYNTIKQLLYWDHKQFKNHKKQVQEAHSLLRALSKFIQTKKSYENLVINNPQFSKKEKFQLDRTQASITTNSELEMLTKSSKLIVSLNAFDKKFNYLQQKIDQAVSSTTILISIYFNVEGYLELVNQKQLQKIGIYCFKDILTSREAQKKLKKLIIGTSKAFDLQDLKLRLPSFDIQEDLAYLRCKNKIMIQKLPKDKIDLVQLGQSINSQYFEDSSTLFGERMDLKFKMLDQYYKKVKRQEQTLAKLNSQYYKNHFRKQVFPEDQEQALKFKRAYLQNEIDCILAEQKACIKKALQNQAQFIKSGKSNYSGVIEEIILTISGTISLLEYMEAEARNHDLTKQCTQIMKIQHRYYASQRRIRINDPFYRQMVQRPLFPNKQRF